MSELETSFPALLHNMSAPPKATINHAGARVVQRGVWVGIPTRLSGLDDGGRMAVLSEWLGVGLPVNPAAAEQELRNLVNAHARTLTLPPACVVVPGHSLATEEETDPLTIVTVLSKSSGHVYLRDKEPNLDRLTWGSHLTLIIPQEWRTK